MFRYLSIVQLFWGTAIAAEMEYRANFVLAAISSIGNLATGLFGLSLFYQKNSNYAFEGWNWWQALLVLGVFTLLQGFSATFLVPNLNRIVRHVQDGTLDFILLKPISSQFWLSTYSLSPWGIPDILFGLGLVGFAGSQLHILWHNYLFSLVPLIFGLIILYSLWFMLGATSIWFVKIYNVTEVLRGLVEAGRYPMAAYPSAYRFFFSFVVPVVFLTTVPVQVMLDRIDWSWLIGGAGLAVVLFWFANRFWQFALRYYTSASS